MTAPDIIDGAKWWHSVPYWFHQIGVLDKKLQWEKRILDETQFQSFFFSEKGLFLTTTQWNIASQNNVALWKGFNVRYGKSW